MEVSEVQKKTALIQVWEEWDESEKKPTDAEGTKLCKIDNPDCEACQ